jgi:hypothetical protein
MTRIKWIFTDLQGPESGCELDEMMRQTKTLPLITLIKLIFTDEKRLVQKK